MEILSKSAENLKILINSINEATFKERFILPLNCSNLPVMGQEGDCRVNPLLTNFFDVVMKIKQPVLYWFEISSHHTAKEIYHLLISTKNQLQRNLPAYKKGFKMWDTKILYVGKVNKDFCGRMIVHLGYYKNQHTQGLQLCHWARNLGLELTLNFIPLPSELVLLTPVFEKDIARELHPLFGKHR